jgi:hypothetical protein
LIVGEIAFWLARLSHEKLKFPPPPQPNPLCSWLKLLASFFLKSYYGDLKKTTLELLFNLHSWLFMPTLIESYLSKDISLMFFKVGK